MGRLRKLFVKAKMSSQGLDASKYKTCNLKQRLRYKYPQLCFSRPSKFYKSEFVFVDTLTAEAL